MNKNEKQLDLYGRDPLSGGTPWSNKKWRRKAAVCYPNVSMLRGMELLARDIALDMFLWDGDWTIAREMWERRAFAARRAQY